MMEWLKRLFGAGAASIPTSEAIEAPPAERTIYWLLGDDTYDFQIVGESHYQDVLERAAGPKCEEGCDEEVIVELRAEPDNLHDANAVQVVLLDAVVGYIPRPAAADLAALLKQLNVPPSRMQVFARITGGWRRPGSEGAFGVRLDLSWPPRVVKPKAD